jgi:hypothetical protein
MSEQIEDWPGIETWASTAQSVPQPTIPEEGLRMTLNDTAPPETEAQRGRTTATDRAVQAGERLLEASAKVGNAYADAYQDAVMGMADFREKVGDAGGVDWSRLAPPGQPRARTYGKPLRDVANTATRLNEQIVGATKKVGLAYVEAYEQMVLGAVELREQAATASDNTLLRTVGSTQAGIARDVARVYADAARRLLA